VRRTQSERSAEGDTSVFARHGDSTLGVIGRVICDHGELPAEPNVRDFVAFDRESPLVHVIQHYASLPDPAGR
jgi:hypothetical protein